jgi:carotenoid cleavage dioxygenase
MTNEELEKEITKVRDFQEIQNLQAQYGYYLSRGPWADWEGELPDIFSDDASVEVAARGVYEGKEGVKRVFKSVLSGRGPAFMHVMIMVMPCIKVYDDETAAADLSLLGPTANLNRTDVGEPISQEPVAIWQAGRYENTYKKVDGVWKISQLNYKMYFAAPYDKGWCIGKSIQGGRSKQMPPDKPPTEFRMYNPKATCKEEQMFDAVLPPSIRD